MTQKLACLYLSEVIPPQSPWFWAALEPGYTSLHGQDHPESFSGCTRTAPLALSEHPRSCSQALGRASPALSPGGAMGDVPSRVQAPQRANQGPSFLVVLQSRAQPLCSAPQPWQKGPDGRRRVFCHPHHRQLHHWGRLGL